MKTASVSAVLIAFLAGSVMLILQTPQTLNACDLAKDSATFDRKTVRFRGTLSVHFEDFSLAIPNCDAPRGIWLAFGGDVAGIVSSVINDNVREPGVELEIDGVSYGIKKDQNFRKLYALAAAGGQSQPLYRVTATLSGVFFAAKDRQVELMGYGHMGCCHLLVITEVTDVESEPPANLKVRGRVWGPDGNPAAGLVVLDDVFGGLPVQTETTSTNDKGDFEFLNSGPLLRVEDPRYRPLAIAVETGGPAVDLKLEDAQRSDWVIAACSEAEPSHRRVGFSMLFTLPPAMESELHKDRTYFVFPRGGSSAAETELFILKDPGLGTERSGIIGSSWSEQRWIKDSAGRTVGIDSRGQDGGSWRTVSSGDDEIATYRLDAGKSTVLVDRILDSVCLGSVIMPSLVSPSRN